MSRRRGEFEHRTSIFEGAFRAWSHLGGLEPNALESRPVSDLDPLNNPIEDDQRLRSQRRGNSAASQNPDGTNRRQYPYEPLPRSGLAHPYVQAILSPWLGPDADNDAIQLGLTTLRTWWQHRRKGESGSAIAALGTEKMKGVVEGYTRHFFTLAHCLIMNDKEQPPRTLHTKMKELEKARNKRNKKRSRDDEAGKMHEMAMNAGLAGGVGLNGAIGGSGPTTSALNADLTDSNLSPLERLHAAQRRQLAESGGVHSAMGNGPNNGNNGNTNNMNGNINVNNGMPDPNMPLIHIKQKCVPGKVDLPAISNAVNHHALQLAHRGTGGGSSGANPNAVTSSSITGASAAQYGDPNTFPIVYIANNGDILLSMMVDGITCAHCVKIVETVLKGCNGNKSPIDGLLDAAADRDLNSVLIKIDRTSSAKRIAFESARNLAMVGYTAKAKDVNVTTQDTNGKKSTIETSVLHNAMEMAGRHDPRSIFNWSLPCTCPDNGVLREDCQRHSQMGSVIFEAFNNRGQIISQFIHSGKLPDVGSSGSNAMNNMNGNGNQGMSTGNNSMGAQQMQAQMANQQMNPQDQQHQQVLNGSFMGQGGNGGNNGMHPPQGMRQDNMDFYGNGNMGHGNNSNGNGNAQVPSSVGGGMPNNHGMNHGNGHQNGSSMGQMPMRASMAQRASIISFGGNGLRNMSFVSEAASFGRAMSGLSALSIDWENMEDFDVNLDHSSHINNDNPASDRFAADNHNNGGLPDTVGVTVTGGPAGNGADGTAGAPSSNMGGGMGGRGGRRSSIRRSFMGGNSGGQDAHVSFRV